MPLSLVLALLIAFWVPVSARSPLGLASPTIAWAGLVGSALVVGGVAQLLGRRIARRATRGSVLNSAVRRSFVWSARTLDILILLVYAGLIHVLGWVSTIQTLPGFRDQMLLQEATLLAPFLLLQVLGWWGLGRAERVLRPWRRPDGVGRSLVLQARSHWGLLLPVVMVLALVQDLLNRCQPGWIEDVTIQTLVMLVLGALVLALAPFLVRLAWPTYPLPSGELRDRLEEVARQHRFRYREILVWDTGGTALNALVTGILPGTRFVLLTDALIDWLDDRQITAVFGHEMGHIAHRHLQYLGFFSVASIGIVLLALEVAQAGLAALLPQWQGSPLSDLLGSLLLLALLGLYFVQVFGFLSRRFERQADLYGCKVAAGDATPLDSGVVLEPQGVSTYISALQDTADLNNIPLDRRTWRYDSIRSRITFLEELAADPEAESRFQRRIGWMCVGLTGLLLVGLGAAWAFSNANL